MSIDQHIAELRAELRDAVYANERRSIEEELVMALAEREGIWAEMDSRPRRSLPLRRLAAVLGRWP